MKKEEEENEEVKKEEEKDDDTISSLNLPSGPKLAWLLRRLAETAEDFENFDNLAENGFERSLPSLRKKQEERTLHNFQPMLIAMKNVWTDDK